VLLYWGMCAEVDSNARWARIAGIKVHEINNLEVEFLNRCQFDLRVTTQEFHDMVLELMAFTRRAHCMEQCAHYHHEPGQHKTHHKTGIKMFHIKPKPRTLLNRNLCSHSEIDTAEFVQPTLIPHHHHHPNSSSSAPSIIQQQLHQQQQQSGGGDSAILKSRANVVGYFHPIPQFNGHIIQGTAGTPDPVSQRYSMCSPGSDHPHPAGFLTPGPGCTAPAVISAGGVNSSTSGCNINNRNIDLAQSASHSPQHKSNRGLIRPYSMQSLASLLSHKSPASLFRHNSRGRVRNAETLAAADMHMQNAPCNSHSNSMSQESICSSTTSMDSSCHRD
jgi:hypothetical protein